MKELTFEEFCDLPLTAGWRFSLDSGSLTYYANKSAGLTISIFTPLKRKGDIYSGWKKSIRHYYLEGDDKVYETSDQAYVAYMEKVCGIGAKK
jgi:hypothetical protein